MRPCPRTLPVSSSSLLQFFNTISSSIRRITPIILTGIEFLINYFRTKQKVEQSCMNEMHFYYRTISETRRRILDAGLTVPRPDISRRKVRRKRPGSPSSALFSTMTPRLEIKYIDRYTVRSLCEIVSSRKS